MIRVSFFLFELIEIINCFWFFLYTIFKISRISIRIFNVDERRKNYSPPLHERTKDKILTIVSIARLSKKKKNIYIYNSVESSIFKVEERRAVYGH